MRFTIAFVFLLYLSSPAWTQNEKDSIINLLSKPLPDTSRSLLLTELAYTVFDKPDSMALLAGQAITLAEKQHFPRGEALGLIVQGSHYAFKYENARALNSYVRALTLAQEVDDIELQARANMNIGNLYAWANDYRLSNDYFQKVKDYAQRATDTLWIANMLLNIGSNYEKLNVLDSARIYVQQANELSMKLDFSPLKTVVWTTLGNIYSKMGTHKLALEFFRLAFDEAQQANNLDALSFITTGIAKIYETISLYDSSLHYARVSVFTDQSLKRLPQIPALELLINSFKRIGALDSALFYQDHLLTIKDSVFGQEKSKQIQVLSFQESLREQRRAEELVRREKDRKDTLQVMGIGTFIIMCFLLLLLLNQRKIKSRFIEVYGVVLLLLVFEFIALLLHPFIERITHHTPILVFLCLVAIAAVLGPLHHKLEHFIKHKIAGESKRLSDKELEATPTLTDEE